MRDPMTTIATIPLDTLRSPARSSDNRSPTRWTVADVEALYDMAFMDLLYRAQQVHREHFDANEIQLSTLLSIKTGGCPEDCAYCPQSARHDTGLPASKLMDLRSRRTCRKVPGEPTSLPLCLRGPRVTKCRRPGGFPLRRDSQHSRMCQPTFRSSPRNPPDFSPRSAEAC